jgi:arginine decarboxylase
MLNIGTTRGAIAYLLEVLCTLAREIEADAEERSPQEERLLAERVESLTTKLPPLPRFSRFHDKFKPCADSTEGDLRTAFFLAYDEDLCEYYLLEDEIDAVMAKGRDVVSANFVTPYPPGYPILVPGQIISEEILAYLKALDVKEIHGYNPSFGLRVFREKCLQ